MYSMLLLSVAMAAVKPNIIAFIGDDMGWANAGWHNEEHVKTPVMNNLLKEGIELDRHYVFFYCSPTRTSLMTGRLPVHITENNAYACGLEGPAPLNITFMPKMLQQGGYTTHHIGKWHMGGLGDHRALPINRGFDTSYGYLMGAEDHYTNENPGCGGCGKHTDLWNATSPAHGQNDTGYTAYKWTAHAVNVIKQHDTSKGPFFMYLAAQCAHAPNEPDKYKASYTNYTSAYGDYNGMISAVDDMAKNVTAALREAGLWDNTLILFASDNGGPSAESVSGSNANNYPLRGGKHTAWEGGHRSLAFLTGGYLPPASRGRKLEGYIHVADWYSTFAHIAGVVPEQDVTGLPGSDSINMWDYLMSGSGTSPRVEMVLSSKYAVPASDAPAGSMGSAAFISGDYKLVRFTQQYCFWMGPVYPNASTTHKNEDSCDCGASGCLYNIKKDPGEHSDLAKVYPDIAAQLLAKAQAADETSIEASRPVGWRGHVDESKSCNQMTLNGGFWGPYY